MDALFRIGSTTMRRERLLSRLLMAVTLVVAALLLAPMEARAHAAHGHAIQPAEPTVQRPVDLHVIEVALISAQNEVSITRTSTESASLLPTSQPKTPSSCPAGCCHSAGTGCCALWLSPTVAILAPALGGLTPIVSAIRGSGITPGALPEPPNSLV